METARGWKLLVVIAVVLTSSCRFKFPTTNEGQLLARKGTFPHSMPAWVKPPPEMGAASARREGLIPSTYGAAQVVQEAKKTSAAGDVASERERQEERAKMELEQAREAAMQEDTAELSPLDRIENVCPGIESEVTAALKTLDTEARIEQYETLTARCRESSDLWFWLARDYQAQKRYAEAIRSYDQVLILDPKNQAAKALLEETRQQASGLSDKQ